MSTVLLTITPTQIDKHRELLCHWLTANGIAPEDVSADLPLTIEQTADHSVICYHELQRSSTGHKLVDPDNRNRVWTVRRTVDQQVLIPGVVVSQVDVTALGDLGASYITVYRMPASTDG
ncbi:hypothetical protein ACFWOG_04415 [Kitasatospora sp. NPDC058406]|uniref:hypothetical protein n=1 Tax=Kitasatospora sp. NPDC058406 TaxID=3346483 RepID=UPI00365B4780